MRRTTMKSLVMLFAGLFWFFIFATQAQTTDLEKTLLANAPPSIVEAARDLGDGHGNPAEIDVSYLLADLDGTRQFAYVVALYQTSAAVSLRVFRQSDNQLQTVADLPQDMELAGAQPKLQLVDIENNGKPLIAVETHGASGLNSGLSLFQFAGGSLLTVTTEDGTDTFDNAQFYDVDNDSRLELVLTPQLSRGDDEGPIKSTGDYLVYKFDGSQLKLALQSSADPTHQLAPDGANQMVFANRAFLHPSHFQLKQIQEAGTADGSKRGAITLRFGNLTAPLSGKSTVVDVNDVDQSTITIGRNIHPWRITILPAREDAEDEHGKQKAERKFEGNFIQAEFSRIALLEFLPRVRQDQPLKAGDTLLVELNCKLKNGAPVFAYLPVEVEKTSAND